MQKILVIEDEPTLREALKTTFVNNSYEVSTAVDGEAGLKLALEQHPDLILLDLRLPKIDGLDVMHQLRDDNWGKDALIIILTNFEPSYSNDDQLEQLNKDKPTYYLIKSNNTLGNILDKVREVLATRDAVKSEPTPPPQY